VDRRNIQVFETLIRQINSEKGVTIVFTTHDLSQAYRMTDKVISLLDGRLIGSSPENIFYGEIEMEDEKSGFIAIPPSIRLAVADCRQNGIGIYIDPRDIMISTDPASSDQWNCLEGRITSITSENGSIRLTINVGLELVAITDDKELRKIDPEFFSKRVFASFKNSSVHMF